MKKLYSILIPILLLLLSSGCAFTATEPAPFTNSRFVDQNGVPYGVEREGNRPFVIVPAWEFSVAAGNITGHDTITKFGRNIEVDNNVTADVWDGGNTVASGGISLIWVAPTGDRIHDITSTSATDNATQGGARTVRIFGLDDWDTPEITEVIIMNGTNDVATVNDYVIIHRMRVLTNGATDINVGTITATARTDNTISAQIRPSQGHTQMAIMGIPSTQKAYIGRFYANINRSGGQVGAVDVLLLVNPDPQNVTTQYTVRHTFGLMTTGTSAFTIAYYVPKVIDGPAIIKVQVDSGANDFNISGGFDVMRVNQ